MFNQPILKYISDGLPAEIPCAAVFKVLFWYPISTHSPGSEQESVLFSPSPAQELFALFEILFDSLWIRNFAAELFTRSSFFLLFVILLPLLHFLCCQTGFSQGGIHPSHPEDCIGLGWAPASFGDSWVSPSNPLQFAYWWRWGTVSHLILRSEIIIFPPSDLTWLYN